MSALAEIYLSSALSNRRTANLCRRYAIENEACKCPELAEKWWDYRSEHIASAHRFIGLVRQERASA